MTGTKKRNKSYKPRRVQLDPVSWAIAGSHKIPLKLQAELREPLADALALLRQGVAKRDDWNQLSNALNLAEALAGLQIGPNLVPAIAAGERSLEAVALRMQKTGHSTLWAVELADITEALEMYRIQVSLCSQAEYSRAVRRVKDMHRGGGMCDVAKLYEGMPA
ncbi:hypothetical protein [Glaciimonas sp. PCH181]|uniref:hypothetical protein n=1 Tax=Glaciimonas sp. PCH181 TaxID=2133943 RepID=UPI000D343839|nr:hypothetical protein [Glaciimonas sp. PCH181]PUA17285.1 hypothetical protein C7W93_15255 [Glaciimonas sp. PCH181]